MSLLNGGLTQAKQITGMSHAQFVDHFLAHITKSERTVLRQLPPAQTPEQLACMVLAIRSAFRRPLPPGHPLGRAEELAA